jgi:hypothetical protein
MGHTAETPFNSVSACCCLCAAVCCAEVLGSLSDWAVVTSGPAASDAELQLTAILNPLTREAQRISQVGSCSRPATNQATCHRCMLSRAQGC